MRGKILVKKSNLQGGVGGGGGGRSCGKAGSMKMAR